MLDPAVNQIELKARLDPVASGGLAFLEHVEGASTPTSVPPSRQVDGPPERAFPRLYPVSTGVMGR